MNASSISTTSAPNNTTSEDWQSNLDKWKSSRRKRNEDVLERVIEVKRNEQHEEFQNRGGLRGKTFNQIQEDKNRRGRRYQLVVHDSDNSDLSELGLKSNNEIEDAIDPVESRTEIIGQNEAAVTQNNDINNIDSHKDYKRSGDAKSDAGFCTGSSDAGSGSDTGGVFAEDSISDTSSALGDKREAHDSLIDSGVALAAVRSSPVLQETNLHLDQRSALVNGHVSTSRKNISQEPAICHSATSSTLSSVSSPSNSTNPTPLPSETNSHLGSKIDKLSNDMPFEALPSGRNGQESGEEYTYAKAIAEYKQFAQNSVKKRSWSSSSNGGEDREREVESRENTSPLRPTPRPRDRLHRDRTADMHKRRSMFELRDIDSESQQRSDRGTSVPSDRRWSGGVGAFGGSTGTLRSKVASFENLNESRVSGSGVTAPRDTKFKEKLASFSRGIDQSDPSSARRRTPERDRDFHVKLRAFSQLEKGGERSSSISSEVTLRQKRNPPPPPQPLKERIASYETLGSVSKATSRSMEFLGGSSTSPPPTTSLRKGVSKTDMTTLSETKGIAEKDKRCTVYETIEKVEVKRDVSSAPIYSIFATSQNEDISKTESDSVSVKKILSEVPEDKDEMPSLKRQSESDRPFINDIISDSPIHQVKPKPRTLPEIPTANVSKSPVAQLRTLPEVPKSRMLPQIPVSASEMNGNSPGIAEATSGISDLVLTETADVATMEYSDKDIDEAFAYECLSEAVTAGDADDVTNDMISSPCDVSTAESDTHHDSQEAVHFYEKILNEDEPIYENIYEKVGEDEDVNYSIIGAGSSVSSNPTNSNYAVSLDNITESGPIEHDYQTVEEATSSFTSKETQRASSPTTPPRHKPLVVFDLSDVSWPSALLAGSLPPPAVPPPPPPDSDEDDLESSCLVGPPSVEGQPCNNNSLIPSPEGNAISDTFSTKQEIRKKMSDFLGTKPPVQEDVVSCVAPPRDASLMLRDHCQSERRILGDRMQQASSASALSDLYSSSLPGSGRPKYTWEDRMRDDGGGGGSTSAATSVVGGSGARVDLDDSGDTFEFHTKLAELEQEMEKHDRDMLQRVKGSSKTSVVEQTPTALPIQEFYTAPTYSEEVASTTREETRMEPENSSECLPAANPVSTATDEATTCDNQTAPPPLPRKKSILALSAIPKPKLTDNDSWIMKKKDLSKRDYNKHWLIQEAEQRRVEQERLNRPLNVSGRSQSTSAAVSSSSGFQNSNKNAPLQTSPGYQSHFQNIKSSFVPATYSAHSNSNPSHGLSNSLSSGSTNSLHSCDAMHTMNAAGSLPYNGSISPTSHGAVGWRKQTSGQQPQTASSPIKTYQPPPPSNPSSGSKPLPDAIINTLTNRVNNKNKVNSSPPRPTVYKSGSTYPKSDENYHDYMNTDAIMPQITNNNGVNGALNNNGSNTAEDQRLLSVSGKKKCSHCAEELGRGAAMIIESLLLFYHIPCFKCSVCGSQLGNGLAGADVRVRHKKLHCHNCYSNDDGMKFSKV